MVAEYRAVLGVPPNRRPGGDQAVKIAGYARVSTDDKQDPGLQREAIERYAQTREHELVEIYEDRGASGAKTSRPGLDRLMEDARRRRFEAVVVWRFDRFARSTMHLLQALQFFRGLKISFVSLTEGIDTTTPVGEMVFTFLAGIAQFERVLIGERVRAGQASARAKGVRFGRKPRLVDLKELQRRREAGQGWRRIARAMKAPTTTLRRYWKQCQKSPYESTGVVTHLAGISVETVGSARD